MATPKAIPPMPYAIPNRKDFSIAEVGASCSTVNKSGIVMKATTIGNINQQTNACANQ